MGVSETAGRCGDTHVRRGRGPVLHGSFPLFAHVRRFEVYKVISVQIPVVPKVDFTPLRVDRFRRRVPWRATRQGSAANRKFSCANPPFLKFGHLPS